MPESVEISVEYHEGDEVYFKVDVEHMFIVTGFVIRGMSTKYLVTNLIEGEIEAYDYELQNYR